MNYELLLIPLIFAVSLALIFLDEKKAFKALLVLSVLLHKELFSIYMWDVLPVRIFMLAFLAFAGLTALKKFVEFKKGGNLITKVKSFLRDPFILLLVLLWVIQGVSIIFTRNLASSLFLYSFSTTVITFAIYFYNRYKNSPQSALNLIRFYTYIVFAAALFGFVQIYLHRTYDFIVGAFWNIPGNIPRIGSTFWDVNHFAALLAALMPVLGVFILTEKTWKRRALYAFMFAVMLVILLLTNSRTAWILGFVSFVTFVNALLFRKYLFKGVLALVLFFVLVSIPLGVEYSDRSSPFRAKIKDYFHYRIDSFDSHILLVRGALEVFEERPIIGGGYGGFYEHFSRTKIAAEYFGRDPAALNTRVPAHTIWGELLSETGILGFGTYLLLLLLMIGTLFYTTLTSKDKKEILLTAAMGSVLVGWHVAGVFYSYKSEFFWLVMILYFTYGAGILKERYNLNAIAGYYLRIKNLGIALIGILAFTLIFYGLGTNHLIPWDEAIYANISRNMVRSGNYIVQNWIPGTVWFEKPPLFMWLMAASMKVLGVSSLAARLPGAIFGLLTIVVTYMFGKKLYNRTVGLIASFILLTTVQFLYYSRTAMTDVTATFFITTALFFYWNTVSNNRYRYWLLAGAFAGLGVMTKGVIGFLPFLVMTIFEIYLILTDRSFLSKKRIFSYILSVLASVAVFMPWHMEMYRRFGQQFLANYIGYHVLERATSSIEDKGRPWYWYFTVLKVSMRVWFIALLGALPISLLNAMFGNMKKEYKSFTLVIEKYRENIFLLVYAVSIFIFFSMATSKLVWYITPIYPALAILVAVFIYRVIENISVHFKGYENGTKFLLLYLLFLSGFTYFWLVKDMVYVPDLTYKQATLLQMKDEKFGTETKVYTDNIEQPLVLYYSDGPYQMVDFGPLENILRNAGDDDKIVFITKESRFRKLKESFPELVLDRQLDEWVLGHHPTRWELFELQLQSIRPVTGDR